jgi:hypothetical protein
MHSEIVRLYISVHDLGKFVQGFNGIEHLQEDVNNADLVSSIYFIINMFIYALMKVFHFNCLAFTKKLCT